MITRVSFIDNDKKIVKVEYEDGKIIFEGYSPTLENKLIDYFNSGNHILEYVKSKEEYQEELRTLVEYKKSQLNDVFNNYSMIFKIVRNEAFILRNKVDLVLLLNDRIDALKDYGLNEAILSKILFKTKTQPLVAFDSFKKKSLIFLTKEECEALIRKISTISFELYDIKTDIIEYLDSLSSIEDVQKYDIGVTTPSGKILEAKINEIYI